MISVETALRHLFDVVSTVGTEQIGLSDARDRILRAPIIATRAQPPFPASAMDGYAIDASDFAVSKTYQVIGEAAAGTAFVGEVRSGQAVRIFTGAPVPSGTNRVVIQEDVDRHGNEITIRAKPDPQTYIRPAGTDFLEGAEITAPMHLKPSDIALAAAMNAGQITVSLRPLISILATGDELVMPGETPGPDQIVASNVFGLKAMLEGAGARVSILPIARDNRASLDAALQMAAGSDLLVTIGGASVGDHDLVAEATSAAGMERAFYKVAMRPGKPLMAGKIGDMPMIGLPGNPVSAMVCGEVFLRPVLDAMLGLAKAPRTRRQLPLSAAASANGPREHYVRARSTDNGVAPLDRQDSSLLSVLASANALVVRPPNDPERKIGDLVDVIDLN